MSASVADIGDTGEPVELGASSLPANIMRLIRLTTLNLYLYENDYLENL